ncbi:MAG: hypothetical protein MUC72_07320 [Acidobacteria bacterium]|jgi:peroxiredoxin|nr:hypothetical protein [Acidobacteriota bacterium]
MRKITLIIFLLVLSFALVILLAYFINKKEHFKNLVPFLSDGEKIPEIIFIDKNTHAIEIQQNQKMPSLLFVFERPCTTCTKNIIYWNKLSELVNKKANIWGVIQDQSDMFEIAKVKTIPFQLISPVNIDVFKKKWRVHLNLAQTYLIYNDKVKYSKIGDICENDVRNIIGMLNEVKGK